MYMYNVYIYIHSVTRDYFISDAKAAGLLNWEHQNHFDIIWSVKHHTHTELGIQCAFQHQRMIQYMLMQYST